MNPSRVRILCLAASLLAGPALAGEAPSSPGQEALDWAFRFASAIETDRKDMGRSQAAIIGDYTATGTFDRALAQVGRVEGWFRGTARADLAAELAKAGRKQEAIAQLAAAAEDRRAAEGWHAERIDAHIARAQAALGDERSATATAAPLATADRQYSGQLAGAQAAALAVQGDFDRAMEVLAGLSAAQDFDGTWNRTRAYLNLARDPRLTREHRVEAAVAARTSAAGIPGWKSAEALIDVGAVLAELGVPDEARSVLEAAEAQVAAMGDAVGARATLVANLARAWNKAGTPGRGLEAVRGAEAIPPQVMVTERPAVWSLIASGYHWAGDAGNSRRALQEALASTEALTNARPRALAAVVLCRTLGRDERDLDAPTRAKLEALLGGLRAPW